jgi:hypothetical protein
MPLAWAFWLERMTGIEPAIERIHLLADEHAGDVALVIALEGARGIGQDPQLVTTMARVGVRVASMAHFDRTFLADGSGLDDTPGGRLTLQGIEVFNEMERLGHRLRHQPPWARWRRAHTQAGEAADAGDAFGLSETNRFEESPPRQSEPAALRRADDSADTCPLTYTAAWMDACSSRDYPASASRQDLPHDERAPAPRAIMATLCG